MQNNRIVVISEDELRQLITDTVQEVVEENQQQQQKQKELMNAKQLCEFLGIHISTLNIWKAKGKIPFKRLGKRIFFNREEVLSSLKEAGSYNKIKEIK